MKNFFVIFLVIVFSFEIKSNEPFVILEYNNQNLNESGTKNINKNNKFIKDHNYSVNHKVKDGESLSGILHKYYGNTGLNMKIIEISIIEINKHAFVRENPHFLYAGKILKIPSVSEIMNLVRNAPDKKSNSKSSQRNHIYFYGN
ncbi:MAG: pilus assembly protein FimV [Rickettsiales bacterium]|nr:pilus assembly protein FimV [Rickettsiales bacterium]RPG14264.1 MAG: pilus assembly protein FimV [Pelagibacteraceae bacterium TMED195]|tara:strand:+ start:40 stop:474 length:435 start_codon:yes stop_codon:yes gene_type:complete